MGAQKHRLRIHLFGEFRVQVGDGVPPVAEWPQRKTEALLKVLVSARGQTFTQDQLIDLLFADLDIDKAVKSLYNRISELRKVLEPTLSHGNQSHYILRVGQGRYCFNPDAECWLDTDAFQAHLDQADQFKQLGRWSEAAQHYREALTIYQGEYLAADRYEEWALESRDRWAGLHQQALLELADCHAQLQQYVRALSSCDALIRQYPSNELGYRHKMMYLGELGYRDEVEAVYRTCVSALRAALGEEPTLETQTVYEDILEKTPKPQAVPVGAGPPATSKSPDGNAIANFLKRMSLASVLALIVLMVSAAAVAGWWGINQFSELAQPEQTPSLAVLAFTSIGGFEDPNALFIPLEDLADGAAMELTHALSQMPGLRVASSTSAFSFRQQPLSPAEVGQQLNVSAVIQGNIRRSGETLRVNLELINVEDGLLLWSGLYDIEINVNAFAGIDETVPAMVEAITEELQPQLQPNAEDSLIERLKRFFSL